MVITERRGRVLIVAIERPAKRNAIDADTAAGLATAFDLLEDDPDLWAGVLTGTSEVFSAGNDMRAGSGQPPERGGPYGLITRRRRTPLVAAVEGYALGGGFELVLSCDVVVASRTASFGLPEVSRGVLPLYGGLFRTAAVLPQNIAREMVLTGDPLDAERAHALGLVNHLTEPGSARDRAVALAERICANSPVAVRHALEVMSAGSASGEAEHWDRTSAAREAVWASDDMQEGVRAFGERRPPRWTNS